MKKIIALTCTLLCSFHCFAENWQDKWAESVLLMENGDFVNAKKPLDEAIILMEQEETLHPYLYVDLARLNLLSEKADEALPYLEKALESHKLSKQEQIRALATKIIAKGFLNRSDTVLDDLLVFKELIDLPVMEMKDSKLFIRSIPNNEYYKKMMTCFLIHCGLCYDKEEFSFLKSNMLVAEKINHCGCQKCIAEYAKTRVCDSCNTVVNPGKYNVTIDELLILAINHCGKHVKQLEDQIACLTALAQVLETRTSIEIFDDTLANIFNGIEERAVYFD